MGRKVTSRVLWLEKAKSRQDRLRNRVSEAKDLMGVTRVTIPEFAGIPSLNAPLLGDFVEGENLVAACRLRLLDPTTAIADAKAIHVIAEGNARSSQIGAGLRV